MCIAQPKDISRPMQTHQGCLSLTHACIMEKTSHHNDAFLGDFNTHQIAELSTRCWRAHLGHLREQRAQGGPQRVCKGGGRVDQHDPVNLRQRQHDLSALNRP